MTGALLALRANQARSGEMLAFTKARWSVVGVAAAGLAAAGCGLSVHSADLFILQRTGQGHTLTLVVSDGGTVRCNGASAKSIPDALLIQARDLADSLAQDVKAKLNLPPGPHSVYRYTLELPDGPISFADTSATVHHELSAAELFATQTAHSVCGLA